MNDELPKMIKIMPDYGPCYASDEEGCVIDITDYFEDHPNIEKIREIENQLYGLASWIDSGEPDDNPAFPWAELDERGLMLAKKIARLIGNIGIPFVYCIHYRNPRYEAGCEVNVSSNNT